MSTNSMRKTTLVAAGLAVAGSLVLTGCKDGNEEIPAAPAAPSAAPSSDASAQPIAPVAPSSSAGYDGSAGSSPAPGGAGGAGGAVAKSGQAFKLGETATVPFSYGSNKGGQIALTVASIEQGNPADLEPLKLGDKAKGTIPYYIRYTVKNTGTTDLSYSSVGHIKGLLGDGTEATKVSIIGKFEKCKDDSLPKGFTNGQTQTNCVLVLAPSAQTKVSGAEYWGDPYNNLSSPAQKGLTWK
ncbi:hypothetical protein [Streptomyces sp. NBC_00091]|uniref:hypothetical protein n=1 Tax=Streptomyces sp. NBC_00091 TaxID=2975648 RepID=UPI00224F9B43|nr:hypothetical protein [Streptomyces sp. NBC_00091]MCX5375475.1 hypothetical protein [Streptomyces sp. NBC_00091]